MSSPTGLTSLIRLRARKVRHLALPQCRWLASSSATGHLRASAGQARMTSAADRCPAPICRLIRARARPISFARFRASRRSGAGAIVPVGVTRVSPSAVAPKRTPFAISNPSDDPRRETRSRPTGYVRFGSVDPIAPRVTVAAPGRPPSGGRDATPRAG